MAINRVFRIRIHPELRTEFEPKFADMSVRAVADRPGSESVTIHRPTAWVPDEYCMVSRWADESALIGFAGDDWNRPVIPPGLERHVADCWVHHYHDW